MKKNTKVFCIFSLCCCLQATVCSAAFASFTDWLNPFTLPDKIADKITEKFADHLKPSVPEGFIKLGETDLYEDYLYKHVEKTVNTERTTKGIIFKKTEEITVTLYKGTVLRIYKGDYAKKNNWPSRRVFLNYVANPDGRKLVLMSSYFIDDNERRLSEQSENKYSDIKDINWSSVGPVRGGSIYETIYNKLQE